MIFQSLLGTSVSHKYVQVCQIKTFVKSGETHVFKTGETHGFISYESHVFKTTETHVFVSCETHVNVSCETQGLLARTF